MAPIAMFRTASSIFERLVSGARMLSGKRLVVFAIAAACLTLPIALRGLVLNTPTVRATLEAMMFLFALAGACLLRTQFAHTRRLPDFLLLAAFSSIGLVNLCVGVLPAALNLNAGGQVADAEMLGDVAAAALFAGAALASADRLLIDIEVPLMLSAAVSVGVVAAVELGGLLLHGPLAVAATQTSSVDGALRHPVALLLVVGAAALFALAASGFHRRARVNDPVSAALLAVGALFLGAACASKVPHHLIAPHGITSSDVARFLGFALLLGAACRQEVTIRSHLATAAALAERRRVARDLHDGLAQDLAFIAAHGSQIADQLGSEHPVVTAAKRALAISRSTISDLTESADASSQEVLESIGQELRERFAVAITVDAQLDAELASDERAHISRIAREAIANAARHGNASNVVVSLRRTENRVVLRVRDDGSGIARPGGNRPPEGFGLLSMRERAESLGGELSIRQRRTGGTELEVVLP